jgi:hypothetical protein
MPFSEPTAFNNTRLRDIPQLIHVNYDKWKDYMILFLSAMRAYKIVTGEDPEPSPFDFNHDDNYHDCKAKEA